ncbi:MAG: hypothetical protein ACFBSE_04645 [Prochloraceae cyanobacterium]
MLKKIKNIVAITITSAIAAIAPEVAAQQKQPCYMINSTGEYIDLSSLCYYSQPDRTIDNSTNNNSVTKEPQEVIREVPLPRYEVRTYYDYRLHPDPSLKFSRPYFNSYRIYTNPIVVPYYGNYYRQGPKFGIGYSNGNFGVGFGYNFRPRYGSRGYYHRYGGSYRDRAGRYFYDRNGVKIRSR